MDYDVLLMPQAEADIAEAYRYLHERVPDLVSNRYQLVKREILSLSQMPNRCPKAPEASKLGIELRRLVFGKRSGAYRIIFFIDEEAKEVQVLAFRHGARKPIERGDL